jgi:hypothetical protein
MAPRFPSGYDAWKTWTPDQDDVDHVDDCPMNEDNHDGEPAVCTCPTPKEVAADRAESCADSRSEK